MADVAITPRVRCDNCGTTADKVQPVNSTGIWERPPDWGSARVDPTHRGTYPNNIGMTDLCPHCLKLVHEAVGNALEQGRDLEFALSAADVPAKVAEPYGTLRVCPKRDAICPHGLGCPYVDGYWCIEPKFASPSPTGGAWWAL